MKVSGRSVSREGEGEGYLYSIIHCKNTGGVYPPLWWIYSTPSRFVLVVNILVVYVHQGGGCMPPGNSGGGVWSGVVVINHQLP